MTYNIKKLIIFIVAILSIASCSKDEENVCEKYNVSEWIKDKVSGGVQNYVTKQTTLCGDDIKPDGTTYIYHEDSNAQWYRKIISKVK